MRSSTPPLVLALRNTLVALDPDTGAHRWKTSLPMAIRRLFPRVDAIIAVLAEARVRGAVVRVDRDTGMVLGSVELPFDPTGAALVSGDRLFLASEGGVACVSLRCELRWLGRVREATRGLYGSEATLIISKPDGTEITRLPVGSDASSEGAGLALGDQVCQPDLRG